MNTLQQQLNKIKEKNILPLYLVQGNEQFLVEKVKKAFLESVLEEDEADLNFGQFNMTETSVEAALQEAESFPFFGDRRLVFIQEPYFLTADKTKNEIEHDINYLLTYVNNPSDFSVVVIFASYDKLDKRKKVTKELTKAAEVIDVSPMQERELLQYVSNYCSSIGYEFEDNALKLLLERTNYNLTSIMSELDKLVLFHTDDHLISNQSINDLVTRSLESNVFSINDFVLSGNVQAAILAFNDLLKQKEEPIKIMAIMMNQFRLLLQVKILRSQGYQQSEMASALKEHPYRIKLAMQKERNFSKKTLSTAYHHLIEADYNIKSGKMASHLQFELFVMQFRDSCIN